MLGMDSRGLSLRLGAQVSNKAAAMRRDLRRRKEAETHVPRLLQASRQQRMEVEEQRQQRRHSRERARAPLYARRPGTGTGVPGFGDWVSGFGDCGQDLL